MLSYFSQIDDNFVSKGEYVMHEKNLLSPLGIVRLIDTEGVYPKSEVTVNSP
jgi:hypothetical protein